jgi:hypothetical protein
MIPLRLSTITLIRSSIKKALSRRITTFSSAMEKHVIMATETMLKNEKMIIIFHRMPAHAFPNLCKILTSYRCALITQAVTHRARDFVSTQETWQLDDWSSQI